MPIFRIVSYTCGNFEFMQGLKSELEKVSPSLGRSAVYLKESRINSLPRQVFCVSSVYAEFFLCAFFLVCLLH